MPRLLDAIGKGTYKAGAAAAGRTASAVATAFDPRPAFSNAIYSIPMVGPMLENIRAELATQEKTSKEATEDVKKETQKIQATNAAMATSLNRMSQQLGAIASILTDIRRQGETQQTRFKQNTRRQQYNAAETAIESLAPTTTPSGVQPNEKLAGTGTSLAGGIGKAAQGGLGGILGGGWGTLLAGAGILGALSQTEAFQTFWRHSGLGEKLDNAFKGIATTIGDSITSTFAGIRDDLVNSFKQSLGISTSPDGAPPTPTERVDAAGDIAGTAAAAATFNQLRKKTPKMGLTKKVGLAAAAGYLTDVGIETLGADLPDSMKEDLSALSTTAVTALAAKEAYDLGKVGIDKLKTKMGGAKPTDVAKDTQVKKAADADKAKVEADKKKVTSKKEKLIDRVKRLFKKFPTEKIMAKLQPHLAKLGAKRAALATAGAFIPGPGWIITAISVLSLLPELANAEEIIDQVESELEAEAAADREPVSATPPVSVTPYAPIPENFNYDEYTDMARQELGQQPVPEAVGSYQITPDRLAVAQRIGSRTGADTAGLTLEHLRMITESGDNTAEDEIMKLYTQANFNSLRNALGRMPTQGELLLAHKLGAKEAAAAIAAAQQGDPEQLETIVPKPTTQPQAIERANPVDVRQINRPVSPKPTILPGQVQNTEATSGTSIRHQTEMNKTMEAMNSMAAILAGTAPVVSKQGSTTANSRVAVPAEASSSRTPANPTITTEHLLKSGIMSEMNYLNP